MIKHNKSIKKKLKKTGGYYKPRESPSLIRIGWPFYNQEWSIPAIMLLGMILWFFSGLVFDLDNDNSANLGSNNDNSKRLVFGLYNLAGTQTKQEEQGLERAKSNPYW